MLKDVHCGIKRTVQQEFGGPVEQVALARIHVRSSLIFVFGCHKILVLLFDFSQQVV